MQLLKHIQNVPNGVYHPLLLRMLNLSARFAPHILISVSDDPIDNLIRNKDLPSVVLKTVPLIEKLKIVASARELARDFDLNIVPGFIDDITSTIFPSYVIDGTYQAHLEKLSLRGEWVDMVNGGVWNSKQYLHYLLNMYSSGVCGVLPSQQTQDKAISQQLTYEATIFITKLLLLEVVNSSRQHLQDWTLSIKTHLTTENGKMFIDTLYHMLGDLQIYNNTGLPQTVNRFITHLMSQHYRAVGHVYTPCTCDTSILQCTSGSLGELKRRWNELVLEHPLTDILSPHTMRQLLSWAFQTKPALSEFSPKFRSHGVLMVLDNGLASSRVPRIHIKITGNVSRTKLSALDRIFPPTSTVDSKHMVTRLSAIIAAMFKNNWRDLVFQGGGTPMFQSRSAVSKFVQAQLLDHYPGTPQNIIICKMLAGFGHTPGVERFVQILRDNAVWGLPPNAMVKVLKQSSTMLRRHKVLPNLSSVSDDVVKTCAYWELCFGRSQFTSCMDDEIINRTTATYHLKHPSHSLIAGDNIPWRDDGKAFIQRDPDFYRSLSSAIREILDQCVPVKPCTKTYIDFLCSSNEWLSSGSAPGAKIKPPSAANPVSVGKRGWAESADFHAISRAIYTQRPVEMAVASEKYENGKGRAIYGVEQLHYMHNSYGTRGLEERFCNVEGLEKGSSGVDQLKNEVKRAKLTADQDVHCMMMDYADFNIQHSPEAMATIFHTLADMGVERGATNDWVVANRWVGDSKYNMRCRFPRTDPTGKKYATILPVFQGMFSGTRSTDLINTILNLAYFKVAQKFVADKYGLHAADLYNVHQGDDVWVSARNQEWCALIYYTLNSMGLVMRSSKQMFGPGRGEFLRVLYNNGSADGYLGRAIPNLLLKEVQRPLTQDTASMLQSIHTSLTTLHRRGLAFDAVCLLYDDLISHFRKVAQFPGDPCPITIPVELVAMAQAHGGIGIPKPTKFTKYDLTDRHNCSAPTFPSIPLYDGPDLNALPSNCTDAWISDISKRLHHIGDINAEVLKRASIRTNYADAMFEIHRRTQMRAYKRDVAIHVGRCRANSLKQKANTNIENNVSPIIDLDLKNSSNSRFVDQGQIHLTSLAFTSHVKDITLDHAHPERLTNIHNTIGAGIHQVLTEQVCTYGIIRPSTQSVLNRVIVRSQMKSVSKLRTALSLTDLQAIRLIIETAILHGDTSDPVIYDLLQLTKSPDNKLLTLLLDHSTGWLGALDYNIQPSIVQLASTYAVTELIGLRHMRALPRSSSDLTSLCDAYTLSALQHAYKCKLSFPCRISY